MMTTLENAISRRAASSASAVSPDTLAYGDQPTTSSVNRVPRSTDSPPTSASIAFSSTSLRDSLIAATCPPHVSIWRTSSDDPRCVQVPRTFALAAANSSSVSAPEACNCARCSIWSAGSAGGGAYCAGSAWYASSCSACCALGALLGHVMTDRRPCDEPPAPRPSPHSHGQPPRVRSAGRGWLLPASDQNRYLTVRKAHASGSVDSARCSRDAPSATPLALCRSSHSCSSHARTPAPATSPSSGTDPNDLVGVVWVLDEASISRPGG